MEPGEICIERAKYITEYLEENRESNENFKLKFAKAVGCYLSHKQPVLLEKNLLAGTMTSRERGINLYPEIGDLVIWRNLRKKGLATKEINMLNEVIFPYWMERDFETHFDERCRQEKNLKAFKDQGFCEVVPYRGFIPDFKWILKAGLDKVLEEIEKQLAVVKEKLPQLTDHLLKEAQEEAVFYESIEEMCRGILAYAKNAGEAAKLQREETSDELQKQIYLKMARNCQNIPARGAQSFAEAMQCIWFSLIAMEAEYSLAGMSIGRLDQILNPYYEKDLLEGRISEEEALSLIKELCTKLYDCKKANGEFAIGITIGGVNEAGEDAVNGVTYLFLRAISSLEGRTPVITARVHREKNTAEYVSRASEVNSEGKIALQDDVEGIKLLVGKGISLEKSRQYAVMIDGVLGIPGSSYEGCQKLTIDFAKIFSLALNNGRQHETGRRQWGPLTGEAENFECFEDFQNAFRQQGEWLVKESIACLEIGDQVAGENLQWPFSSLFFKGCVQRGEDVVAGGSIYADTAIRQKGLEEAARYLSYVEQFVFKEKTSSLTKAVKHLKALEEYKDTELNSNIKTEIISKNREWIEGFFQNTLKGYSNARGGEYF